MKTMDAKLAFEGIKNLLGIPSHKLDDLLECLTLLERDSYNRGIKTYKGINCPQKTNRTMDREEQLKIYWEREHQLVEAFEQYTGYKLELEDVGSWIAFQAFCAGYKLKEKELLEYNFQNNAKENFKFFLDEKNQPCLNIRDEKELIACFILDKDEFSDLIRTLLKLNTLVK